jgi:hypothetical protein
MFSGLVATLGKSSPEQKARPSPCHGTDDRWGCNMHLRTTRHMAYGTVSMYLEDDAADGAVNLQLLRSIHDCLKHGHVQRIELVRPV